MLSTTLVVVRLTRMVPHDMEIALIWGQELFDGGRLAIVDPRVEVAGEKHVDLTVNGR